MAGLCLTFLRAMIPCSALEFMQDDTSSTTRRRSQLFAAVWSIVSPTQLSPRRGAFRVAAAVLIAGAVLFVSFGQSPTASTGQEGRDIKMGNLFLGSRHVRMGASDLSPTYISSNSMRAPQFAHIPDERTLGSAVSAEADAAPRDAVTEYVVQEGDTLGGLAERFGLQLNTLLWANDISDPSAIQPGMELIVLPMDGVLHYVKEGETVSHLTEAYGISQEKIMSANDLSADGSIAIGDLLVIPGGEPRSTVDRRAPSQPLADNLFMYPIPSPHRVTQGRHWYNAVDFSNGSCGEAVFAAAAGTVQQVDSDNVAGTYLRLMHRSEIITLYGHLSQVLVSPGEQVSQGQIIARTGHSGYTIPRGPAGCHLHFEVRGARNPFAG